LLLQSTLHRRVTTPGLEKVDPLHHRRGRSGDEVAVSFIVVVLASVEAIEDGCVGAQDLDEHGRQSTCASPNSSWCVDRAVSARYKSNRGGCYRGSIDGTAFTGFLW
jgi:hypothetical protein